ncbi:hypothetical protein A9Q99_02190 [Gammaproteobacteria bacterium 45_16_T64]|nr:hypothetical protein A9Q99_02190 [Gammaproteobacteria bacterium 45_16_T64]
MYETMEVYSLSWLYFLSFIFLTTFAFLNMVIGIIVNVMEEEHEREREARDVREGKVTLEDLHQEIAELKRLIQGQSKT